MSDWPDDMAPLPHAATEDRLRVRLAGMVAGADCGAKFDHDPHGFLTSTGHVKACDGSTTKRNDNGSDR